MHGCFHEKHSQEQTKTEVTVLDPEEELKLLTRGQVFVAALGARRLYTDLFTGIQVGI